MAFSFKHESTGYTASAAFRWLICTGSARLGMKFPKKPPGEAAKRGRALHALTDEVYKTMTPLIDADVGNSIYRWTRKDEHKPYYVEAEDVFWVNQYTATVLQWRDQINAKVFVEQECYHFTRLDGDFPKSIKPIVDRLLLPLPTPDSPSYNGLDPKVDIRRPLIVMDLKTGKSLKQAEGNPQLMICGLGAIRHVFPGDNVPNMPVWLVIYQPTNPNGPLDIWETSTDELLNDWAPYINKGVYRGETNPVYIPSQERCLFCNVPREECPAYGKVSEDIVTDLLPIFDKDLALLTPEEIELVLTHGPKMTRRIEAIKKMANKKAIEGQEFNGFRLMTPLKNREYTDKDKVVNFLIAKGLKAEDFMTKPELLSITQLEKKHDPEVLKGIEELITRPPGDRRLAPIDKKKG